VDRSRRRSSVTGALAKGPGISHHAAAHVRCRPDAQGPPLSF
jgi:hypothetical protein